MLCSAQSSFSGFVSYSRFSYDFSVNVIVPQHRQSFHKNIFLPSKVFLPPFLFPFRLLNTPQSKAIIPCILFRRLEERYTTAMRYCPFAKLDKYGLKTEKYMLCYCYNTSLQVFEKNNAQGTLCSIISLQTNIYERK